MIVRRESGVGAGVRRGRGVAIEGTGTIGRVEGVVGIGAMIGEIVVKEIDMMIGIEIGEGEMMTIIGHDDCGYLKVWRSCRLEQHIIAEALGENWERNAIVLISLLLHSNVEF